MRTSSQNVEGHTSLVIKVFSILTAIPGHLPRWLIWDRVPEREPTLVELLHFEQGRRKRSLHANALPDFEARPQSLLRAPRLPGRYFPPGARPNLTCRPR